MELNRTLQFCPSSRAVRQGLEESPAAHRLADWTSDPFACPEVFQKAFQIESHLCREPRLVLVAEFKENEAPFQNREDIEGFRAETYR